MSSDYCLTNIKTLTQWKILWVEGCVKKETGPFPLTFTKTKGLKYKGFEIAEADLRLRGPGNIEGTQQSCLLNLHIADLGRDGEILRTARELALRILEKDPELQHPLNVRLREQMEREGKKGRSWGG
ncbi:MAG: hypothetical protein GC192_23170 [Bacteroidetes bacterium]|nr:hypothetical protein [Bacteroidota bacterium]